MTNHDDGYEPTPLYSTHTPVTQNPEPEKAGPTTGGRKRKRPNRSRRLARQRDRLAAENAAMRATLAEITAAILDNGRQLQTIGKETEK